MKKNIFFSKKYNKFFLITSLLFITFVFIYCLLFFLEINQKYITIKNDVSAFYIIPKDKEGEKVKFIDKKSLNKKKEIDLNQVYLDNINQLEFTLQLFSNTDFNVVNNYLKSFINLKSNLVERSDLYVFAIETEIGIDYFLSYKNFSSKNEAETYCKKSNFLNECLILNPKVNNFEESYNN